MSDSTVFNAGQSLRRREMMKAAVVGAAGVTAGAASSGTVAAEDGGGILDRLPDPSPRHAITGPIEYMYHLVAPAEDGFTKESVKDMSAENTHLRIWNGARLLESEITGSIDNLQNYINPDDPLASSQAEMVFSKLRTRALQAVQDGKSTSDATSEAYDEAMDELSIPYVNLIRQWNSMVYELTHMAFPFIDDDEVEWESSGVEHEDGEVLDGFDSANLSSDDGLPPVSDVFRDHMSTGSYEIGSWAVHVEEFELPNGDTHPVYWFNPQQGGNDRDYHFDGRNSNNGTPFIIVSPENTTSEGDTIDNEDHYLEFTSRDLGFRDLVDALDEIQSGVSSEAIDYVTEIMDSFTAGDIDEMDILSSYDLVREYGDSGEMTRHTAELLAAGLDAPDDVTNEVTIHHPDTGVATGRMFLDWDWTELADWEYTYDPDAGTLKVEPASIDEEPELVVSFDDADDVMITADDLDGDGLADLDVTGDEVEAVERVSQGEVHAHIPVDKVTDHWNSAIFLEGDDKVGSDQTFLDSSEPFELVSVEDEDGDELDKLELNGWLNQTRDPARSLEEAERTADQYVTVDELEETGGGGGGGGDSNTLLIGGMVLALVGMILAALMGDS